MDEITCYLKEDAAVNRGSEKVVHDGIFAAQRAHKQTMKAHADAIKQAELDAEEAKKQKIIRKEQRKIAREKAAKDKALAIWEDDIREKIIFKGVVEPVFSMPLSDVTGNYLDNGAVICAPGGHLMQIYYVMEDILKRYPNGLKTYLEKKVTNDDEDYFLRANNLRELILENHFMPFIMQYLKDMKAECVELMIHPKALSFILDKTEASVDDLSSLSDEDLIKFKELFIGNRISAAHKDAGKSMEILYDFLIDILAKRVPIENVSVKVEQIISKVKLVEMPEGLYHEDCTETVVKDDPEKEGAKIEEKVDRVQNTNESAVLVIRVPKVEKEKEVTTTENTG